MTTIAYCSPFVPPEWIAAHGLSPRWLWLRSDSSRRSFGAGRAVCPYAGALTDAAVSGGEAAALVLTTACDQMRYAAALVERNGGPPTFLMNVPSTWEATGPGRLYLEELKRLGRFLVRLGGRQPTDAGLAMTMANYERGRRALCAQRDRLGGRQYARALAEVRGQGWASLPHDRLEGPSTGVRLAIVGGPVLETHLAIYDWIEQSGGRLVLDATEGGERTLPAAFDQQRTREDPVAELARAYFAAIPDVFRRPNSALYEWLGEQLTARDVRGILFHRYVWCDLWHAELSRFKAWSTVPVVEIDACDDGDSRGRVSGRIEALLEMLP